MLKLYASLMIAGTPLLRMILRRRCRQGKEDPGRLNERMGHASCARPENVLIWFHAASVGEAQSTLILIDALQAQDNNLNILVTTGTVTSAVLMEKRLPARAFHQYYPLDHPRWVARFLDHWQPDLVLWMESELWPNMLSQLQKRGTPIALINARLSGKSHRKWKRAGRSIEKLLGCFSLILAQTEQDQTYYEDLGATNVTTCDNLKYSSAPLPYKENDLEKLKKSVGERPLWLFSSTHDGEEAMACRIHSHLKNKYPDLLTIIVPRHPERREDIQSICKKYSLEVRLRGHIHTLPAKTDDIYIADTLGELGLFYRLAPVVCMGRSFSNDGGGGHNPIEAAQLDCAVLHGPNVQNLEVIYKEMDADGAAMAVQTEDKLIEKLSQLLDDEETRHVLQNKAAAFALNKSRVVKRVLQHLQPLVAQTGLTRLQQNQDQQECA